MGEDSDSDSEQNPKLEEEDKGASENAENEGTSEAPKRKRKRKRKKKKTEEEENEQEVDAVDEEHSQNSVECTVYVEGIPFDASPDQVKEFFVSNGIEDVKEMRLPTWQDSGRLRGYGHVLFGSESSFKNALKLSGKYLQKRYLTIQAANAPKGGGGSRPRVNLDPPPPDCTTLFVHNLSYGATEDEVSQVFGKHGDIVDDGVRIARNSVTRQSKGFAYVEFESPNDAQKVMKACAKRAFSVGGRIVRLDYDTGRMKGSFRSQTGRLWTKEKTEKRQRTN
eukprot:CAMPEP_0113619600 /NCGR_PEP_ID=MMETSP0017_2-20120614/9955_1 /TAXON_ID=2856 /ORGANISM="Cylindrotheca closterium" /LENGTH=279 /DNA_ID=CAMNT_0000529183 /DNA_START=35 /DNA_END=871 /DNA_ORIENTATION=+ /assembly_acc=CAM_ASM_000147